ncbi:Methyl farnesoate epoxidase [Orchesella cincta]|uniref:Methyl farnesoate epoxidase n=1 Tax=Orchesella cincta TaxID=48709 RepID=A0A1D2MBS4_ORCCI|nr:Methyl farnesoate epoxidase [Orchesella cincta]
MLCVLLGVITATLLLFSIFIKNDTKNGKPLPPGPYRYPLVGNLVQLAMINLKEPYRAFTILSKKYGDIMSIQIGTTYAVVLNTPAIMEEYLSKPEFLDRYCNEYIQERTLNKRLGIIFAKYPDPWTTLRRFTLRGLKQFGFGKRNAMISTIQNELPDVVEELKRSIKEGNGIHDFDGYFALSFLNVLWTMLAGRRYKHSDPKLKGLIKSMRIMMATANASSNILMAYPQMKDWFRDWTGLTMQQKGSDEMIAFAKEFIDDRKKLGLYKTNPENMVDEFLREIDAHKGDEDNVYTEEELVILIVDFFLAGSDTTNNTLSYCVLLLMLNPWAQKRLQAEIDLIVPNGSFPTAEHESELHYVRATIAETHRISCVFPVMVPRATVTDTQCGKYFIPKGTFIMANIHGIHFNKSHWKDPDSFRPERFLDDDGKFKSDDWLRPFGFGKRNCPGQALASMSLFHYLIVLMQNFTFYLYPTSHSHRWNLSLGYQTDHNLSEP